MIAMAGISQLVKFLMMLKQCCKCSIGFSCTLPRKRLVTFEPIGLQLYSYSYSPIKRALDIVLHIGPGLIDPQGHILPDHPIIKGYSIKKRASRASALRADGTPYIRGLVLKY